MITRLRIQNFKAWRDTGEIRMAPLTIFFGSNSSGKSSISQFLLMLKQTAQLSDTQRVLHPGDKFTAIDMGTYKDMVHEHDENRVIGFSVKWDLPAPIDVKDPLSSRIFSGTSMQFGADVSAIGNGNKRMVVNNMEYVAEAANDRLSVGMKRRTSLKDEYELSSSGYDFVRNQGRAWPPRSPVRFYGFPDEVIAYYQNADFVRKLNLALEDCLKHVYYLGPLRHRPERSYTWSGENPDDVGFAGENSIKAMLSASDRKISRGLKMRSKPFGILIAEWLKEMRLIDSFQVDPVAPNKRDYEVLVRTIGSVHPVNLPDVGFGVSQVLPVLVQCFYAPAWSTIVMEQPEIHLHPEVQASLADLFAEVIKAREEGKDRHTQLIIESHSEHFLRRLQRNIAEGKIARKDVAAYFCKPSQAGSVLEELDVDTSGHIKNWPENFFGDEMGDLVAMTKKAMERKATGESAHG